MSFMKSLKSLADDFKDSMGDKNKKDEHKQEAHSTGHSDSTKSASDNYYQQQQPHQEHGHQSHQDQYSQHQYGAPEQQHYGGPPPPQDYGAPPSGPHLPPGWNQQWDPNSQRNYYLEQATGRTQWNPPVMLTSSHNQSRGYGAPLAGAGLMGGLMHQSHGYSSQSHGYDSGYGQPGHGAYPGPGAQHLGGSMYPHEAVHSGEHKKDSSKTGLYAAGAGGLLVGGMAGAAWAGDSSDDEHHASHGYASHGASHGGGYGAPPPGGDPYGSGHGAPHPNDPQALEHNSDVSSSQRESLEEAREDYEEAQTAANDSDASSSDHEEAAEARDEYEEEVEDAEEEAYDD